MNLGSTYLIVKDMQKSIEFYEKLLNTKPKSLNIKRWAEFHIGNSCIALFNPKYDEELIKENEEFGKYYNREYLEFKNNNATSYGNNFVFNFGVYDLNK